MISRLNPIITSLILALAYFVTGRLGLMLPAVGTNITLIWLPTGIAVAALLRYGYGCWPGVALGAVAVNLAVRTPLPVAVEVAVGNTLGPLLAALALRRMGFHPAFDRKRDILILALAAILGMLVSASLGVIFLSLAGVLPVGRTAAWLIWWASDTMGVIIAAPLVFAITLKEVRAILVRRAESAAWLCATAAVSWGVFVLNKDSRGEAWALAFVPLPMVAWAALRSGPVGTSVALIVISVIAAYGTGTEHGPFYRQRPIEGVTVLWIFMATAAALGWLITALQAARVYATGIQKLFEQALTDVSLGVLLAGMDRRITYANHGFTKLTGYTEAEMLGKSCAILQGPDSDPETVKQLNAALHGDGYFDGEILNCRKDGTTFWNALLISPVHNEDGVATGFLGIQRDITQRKHAELALRESEVRYRELFDANPHPMWVYDLESLRFLAVNAAAVAHYGYSREEFLAMTIRDIRPPEDIPALIASVGAAVQGIEEAGVWRHRRRDGTLMAVEISSHQLEFDGRHAKVVLAHDVTERRELLRSFQESQVRLETLVSNLPGMAYRCQNDPNWTMTYVSDGCEPITGYRRDELECSRAVAYADLVHPEDRGRLWSNWVSFLESGTPWQNEYRILDRNGRERWVSERASGVFADDGALLFVDGFIQNITAARQAKTEREQLDRKVRETQKLESLGVLAGGIAHDFNNLLTTILGNASLAEMDVAPGSPTSECLTQITEASLRAADLCKQMLAYSGRGRFVVQTLDLGQLVEQTAQMLQISISKKSALRFRLEKGLPPVEVDATQIRQVTMNLVINASEAIGDKSGIISISTGLTRVDHAYFAGTLMDPDLPEGEYVFMEVSDTGSGMSPETQARIFDPFFTTKFTGRGLGLAAVLGIVRGHKGAMKVYSELGRGTTFKLLFPAARAVGETSPAASTVAEAWRSEGTVLVVDDEETMRSTVARMLRHFGIEPVLASDGREAVEIFRADPKRFALVLLDLTMPHMDGEQTFTELRRMRSDVRVVLMSGFNAQEAILRFTGKGLASFLQKPFGVAELRTILQSVRD